MREVLATGEFAEAGEPEILIDRDGEKRILGLLAESLRGE